MGISDISKLQSICNRLIEEHDFDYINRQRVVNLGKRAEIESAQEIIKNGIKYKSRSEDVETRKHDVNQKVKQIYSDDVNNTLVYSSESFIEVAGEKIFESIKHDLKILLASDILDACKNQMSGFGIISFGREVPFSVQFETSKCMVFMRQFPMNRDECIRGIHDVINEFGHEVMSKVNDLSGPSVDIKLISSHDPGEIQMSFYLVPDKNHDKEA